MPTDQTIAHDTHLSASMIFGAIAVMFLLALCYPLISVGLSASPPMTFAAMRAAIAGLVLLMLAQYQNRPSILGSRLWLGVVLIGVLATGIGFFGMFFGGARVSPGLATVISNSQPLIAAALAWWVLDDRLTSVQRWGLLAGFCGVVLIGFPSASGSKSQLLGIAVILLGAVGIAIGNIIMSRIAVRIDIIRATGWQLVIGSVPLAILAAYTEDATSVQWSFTFIAVLLMLSLLGTAAPYVLWFALLQKASLNKLNSFTFITPILALLLGMMFFAETIPTLAFFGIGLSLTGVYWVNKARPVALLTQSVGPSETHAK